MINFIFTERGSDGKYLPALNPAALDELRKVKEKLVVVSAIGDFRTGKSYLLNRLARMAGGAAAFTVGHKAEPQTIGLWLQLLDHPTIPGYKLALVDTEGIGDTKKGDIQHDAILFILSCLLSNTMMYNGKNAIDEDAFEKLDFTAEMSKYLLSNTRGECDGDDDIRKFFPELIYIVRDFSLELEVDGMDITADEYFEEALDTDAGADQETLRARVRQCIKKYFRRRKCFTLDIPAASRRVLSQMDVLEDDNLNPDFVEAVDDLCRYVLVESKAKTVQNGRCINGEEVATLVETYVKAYRESDIPNVSSAMENLKLHQNTKALDEAELYYREMMEEFKQQKMPTENIDEIKEVHKELVQLLIINAQKSAILDDGEVEKFLDQLQKRLVAEKERYLQENRHLSIRACEDTLSKLYQPIDAKKAGEYLLPGGYSVYQADMKDLEHQYKETNGLGIMKEQVLLQFMTAKQVDADAILAADEALSDGERQVFEQQRESEHATREKERMKEEAEEAQRRANEFEEQERESKAMVAVMQDEIRREREETQYIEDQFQQLRREQEMKMVDQSQRYQKLFSEFQLKTVQLAQQREQEKTRRSFFGGILDFGRKIISKILPAVAMRAAAFSPTGIAAVAGAQLLSDQLGGGDEEQPPNPNMDLLADVSAQLLTDKMAKKKEKRSADNAGGKPHPPKK